MTRDEAIALLRKRGDETPHAEIEACYEYLGITRERFDEIVGGFRNAAIWSRRDGTWVIEDFLIHDWEWTEAAAAA